MFQIWKTDKQQNYSYEEVDEIWRLLDYCSVQVLLFYAPVWQRNDCIIKTFSSTCCLEYL
jgi:hypothetical protein